MARRLSSSLATLLISDLTRLQEVDGRHGVIVAAIPAPEQGLLVDPGHGGLYQLEFVGRDVRRQGRQP